MALVPVPGGLPRPLLTQLATGSPTDDDDCAAVAALTLISWASHERVGPDKESEVKRWVAMFRDWADAPTGGMLIRAEVLKAYRSPELRLLFRNAGLVPLLVDYYFRIDWEDLKRQGQKNKGIHLPLDYGTLQRSGAPIGDPNFRGDHSVPIIGFQTVKSLVYVNEGDPLFDGRRHGIPNGWQKTRWTYFKAAAGDFAEPDQATAIVVHKSEVK